MYYHDPIGEKIKEIAGTKKFIETLNSKRMLSGFLTNKSKKTNNERSQSSRSNFSSNQMFKTKDSNFQTTKETGWYTKRPILSECSNEDEECINFEEKIKEKEEKNHNKRMSMTAREQSTDKERFFEDYSKKKIMPVSAYKQEQKDMYTYEKYFYYIFV